MLSHSFTKNLGPRGTLRNGPWGGEREVAFAWPKTTRLTVFRASDPRVNVKADFLYTHKQQENALPEVFQSTRPSTVKHELSSFYYQQSTSLREMLMVYCFFQVQRGRIGQLHCQHIQLTNHKYVVKSFSYATKWSHPKGDLSGFSQCSCSVPWFTDFVAQRQSYKETFADNLQQIIFRLTFQAFNWLMDNIQNSAWWFKIIRQWCFYRKIDHLCVERRL